jgi:hypothetical protein
VSGQKPFIGTSLGAFGPLADNAAAALVAGLGNYTPSLPPSRLKLVVAACPTHPIRIPSIHPSTSPPSRYPATHTRFTSPNSGSTASIHPKHLQRSFGSWVLCISSSCGRYARRHLAAVRLPALVTPDDPCDRRRFYPPRLHLALSRKSSSSVAHRPVTPPLHNVHNHPIADQTPTVAMPTASAASPQQQTLPPPPLPPPPLNSRLEQPVQLH